MEVTASQQKYLQGQLRKWRPMIPAAEFGQLREIFVSHGLPGWGGARVCFLVFNRLIATSYRGEEATAAGGEFCYLSGGGGRTVVGIRRTGRAW